MGRRNKKLSKKALKRQVFHDVPPEDDLRDYIKDNKIKVSVYGASIRTKYWMGLYNSLSNNFADFELVLCGHIKPDFELPPNLIHIYSEVKPAQCSEIACRNSTGKFVMLTSDDHIFNKHCLDHLIGKYREENNEKAIVGSMLGRTGGPTNQRQIWFLDGDYAFFGRVACQKYNVNPYIFPYMATAPFMTKKLYQEMGGADLNFVAIFWMIDLMLRIQEAGGKIIFSEKSLAIEQKVRPRFCEASAVYGEKQEAVILYDRWCKKYSGGPIDADKFYDAFVLVNGVDWIMSKSRLMPFEPFKDKDILIRSQGEKAHWK